VSAGSYLLEVHCHSHAFAPLRVDVSGTSTAGSSGGEKVQVWGTFRGNEWGNKGEEYVVRKVGGVWVWDVRVIAEKEYFYERSGFSPLSLLKNPMILIAGVSMIIVFGMPYLMDNMDPEMRAEFEERQKSTGITGGPGANPLQNFDAAAWLAGSSSSAPKRSDTPVEKGITR
ncbi:ER membrane protein complex subunit-like protein, partial [Lachnellula occidentalis]